MKIYQESASIFTIIFILRQKRLREHSFNQINLMKGMRLIKMIIIIVYVISTFLIID